MLVESLLEGLFPDYGQQCDDLTLRLGNKVIECCPYGQVDDMTAFLWVDRPTSEYAEEIAYCLVLAQEAARSTRASADVLRPVVIAVRDTKVVMVTVEVNVGYLKMLEKEVSAMLEGKTVALKGGGLDVKVLKWDLCSQGGRRQFLECLMSLLQMRTGKRSW
jgi:hypothetical protein